jgi:hypothetical protein
MDQSLLIRQQVLDSAHSVTVWRQVGQFNGEAVLTYRKVWEGPLNAPTQGWLSWGLHENFLLTLLAGRGVTSAVTTLDLHKDAHRIELLTLDAGPELQRDWIKAYPCVWTDQDLMKLGYHTLKALVQIHREGVVHGDLKADNICVPATSDKGATGIDWQELKLIDFAFSLSRDYPLRFVLPLEIKNIDYLPHFYKNSIVKSQQMQQPELVQKSCCAEIDLFSLGVMLMQLTAAGQGDYPGTTALAQECLRVGSKSPRWRWLKKLFQAETVKLEQVARQWLNDQGLTREEVRCSYLVVPGAATVTPLRSHVETVPGTMRAEQTPLLKPTDTPLVERLPVSTAAALSETNQKMAGKSLQDSLTQSDVNNPQQIQRNIQHTPLLKLWQRWRWACIYTMMIVGLFAVDSAYQSTQMRLTESGYLLALMGMAFALPLSVCVLLQIRNPSVTGDRICSGLTIGVMIVSMFHGLSVHLHGLPVVQEFQMFLPWLLAMAMWIKKSSVGK